MSFMHEDNHRPITPGVFSIVHYALLFSRLILVAVAYYLAYKEPDWSTGWVLREDKMHFFYAISGISALTLLLAFKFPLAPKRPRSPEEHFASADEPKRPTPSVYAELIARSAISDAVAVWGFALAFIHRSALISVVFGAVSALCQIIIVRSRLKPRL